LRRSRVNSVGRMVRAGLLVVTAVGVAACSGLPTVDDLIPQAPKFELKTLPSNPSFRPSKPPTLIAADGSCAGGDSGEFTGGGIALEMSECDVVQRIGAPENIDVSANRRGDRTVTLTYQRNDRPGIYRFVAGRLKSIERVAEPQSEPPAKKSKARPRA
jgi:hypothetical protein